MLISGRIISTIGEPFTPWSFVSALDMPWGLWVCHLVSRLRIKVYLNLTCLLGSIDFNWFALCPWVISFFQKLCPAPFPPVSCSSPEPCLGPQCCLYPLLERQPENSWPFGEKYCLISNSSRYSGLHLLYFLQHVQQQHLSVTPLKEALQKFANLYLGSYKGQVIFKGQIPVPVCIRYQDKVTIATGAGLCCLFR